MKHNKQFIVSIYMQGNMVVNADDEPSAKEQVRNHILTKFPDVNITEEKVQRLHNLKGNNLWVS